MDIYVLDTSALLNDVDLLNKLSCCKIVIHTIVLDELDKLSQRGDRKGALSRRTIENLFKLRKRGDLYKGIRWNHKIVKFSDIEPEPETYLRFGLSPKNNDNLLLSVSKEIKDRTGCRVVLATGDKCFALKAGMDIEVEYVGKAFNERKKKHKNKGYFNNSQMTLR